MELTMVAAGSTTRHVPRGAERDQQRSSHGHDSIRGTRTLIERHHGHKLILSTSMPSESRKIDVQVEMHGQSVPIFEHRDIPPSGSSSSSGDAADAGSSSGTPPPPEQEQQQQEERHSSLTVMHLLPVMLAVSFPDTYPSQQPPKFTLSSSWHSASALSSLCRKFDQLGRGVRVGHVDTRECLAVGVGRSIGIGTLVVVRFTWHRDSHVCATRG